MKKIESVNKGVYPNSFVETHCCEETGKLYVVKKNGDPKINFGKDYPAFFYCSNCFTACDGNSNIIGKYDKEKGEVINLDTGEIVPYDTKW